MGIMDIQFFNRHESMDSETRHQVLDLIRGLYKVESNLMDNWLYGLFDGYNYSPTERFKTELANITEQDPELGQKIADLYAVINTYPVTKEPNNNEF